MPFMVKGRHFIMPCCIINYAVRSIFCKMEQK